MTNTNVLNLVENAQTSEFYPTPKSLVEKMLNGIDFNRIDTVLEPSAGKGDILRELAFKENMRSRNHGFDVDCIEIDPNLRQILNYNFGSRKQDLREKSRNIKNKYEHAEHNFSKGWIYYNGKEYVPIPVADRKKLDEIAMEERYFFSEGIHIVHDDFFTFNPYKQYDLIIMNPPFSNGDKHLLKAIKIQENGGCIVCLLNAETLRNPYNETRKELVKRLDELNASIEYIENAFISSERSTAVEVALVKIFIEKKQEESDIFSRFEEAEQAEEFNYEATELEVTDYIKAAVNRFNVEVKSSIELIRQYKAMIPYMLASFDKEACRYNYPILTLTVCEKDNVSVNKYLKAVRYKYWSALLSNPKFTGKLTSKLQEEYRRKIDSLSNYDFTEYNIYSLSAEINAQVKRGIEEEIIAMFDRLTEEHTYYPECQQNRHYYNGWKTNKAHKIGKKVIIPCYGVFDSYDGKPRTYNVRAVFEDIERIFNFFDGHMTRDIDFWISLENCFNQGITKNIELKYFKATFYKKGTVHLTFTCPELIDRFNIYAAQNKGWLPPCYGKKAYKDMDEEEQTVIDSFQGEKEYNKVLENSDYYLAPVTSGQVLMIG